jgi:hypothetical protein
MSVDFRIFPDIFKEVNDLVIEYIDPDNGLVPYFGFGTYLELLQMCQTKDNNQQTKYPLIWLVWETSENQQKWIEPYMYNINVRLFICDLTKVDNTTEQRYDNVMRPILYPIFSALYEALGHHPNIQLGNDFLYPSNDHPFWLNNSGDTIFDPLSSIEVNLQNLLIQKV